MKKVFILIFQLISFAAIAQNIKIEIVDYLKTIEGTKYSTYQYANASYSYSRPLIVFITDKDQFIKVCGDVPVIFRTKQEYTDIFILGIENFTLENITKINKKIIDLFLESIIKYRGCNNLPIYTKEKMYSELIYLDKQKNFCKYLSCKKLN